MRIFLSNAARNVYAMAVQNPRTTAISVTSFLVWLIGKFGFQLTADDQMWLVTITVLFLGIISRDGNAPKVDK